MTKKKFVEIEKVIGNKNPSLLKWIPGFLLSYIKRIAHETEVNEIMEKHAELKELAFVNALIEEFF